MIFGAKLLVLSQNRHQKLKFLKAVYTFFIQLPHSTRDIIAFISLFTWGPLANKTGDGEDDDEDEHVLDHAMDSTCQENERV